MAEEPTGRGRPTVFEGFELDSIDVGEVVLRVRHGGSGPGVVLLHGHPRTHTTWYRVAPILAERFTVVCPDLRGYGGSSKPEDRPDHSQASKGEMARDIVRLMAELGHGRFAAVGHDRGAYVAIRLALDHPDGVTHLAVLDAVPIGEALARTNAKFAQAWPHWFFFGVEDKPERAILCDPDAWYGGRPEAMGRENYEDYHRAIHDRATVHAMIEDYRAGLGVDRAADEADMATGRRISVPTLVLWARDDLPDLYGDPLEVWSGWADHLDGRQMDSGHHMGEEIPDGTCHGVTVVPPVEALGNVGRGTRIPQAMKLSPRVFEPDHGRFDAIKMLVVVKGDQDVDATVPKPESETFTLLYDPNAQANRHGFLFSDGDAGVTFEACPGMHAQYNGGFIATRPSCASLKVHTETSFDSGTLTIGRSACP